MSPLRVGDCVVEKGSALPNKAAHRQVEVTFAERREGRTLPKERNSHNTDGLIASERPPREDEDSEPETSP